MEIEFLRKGQTAPWSGYLISERMMTVLYRDARRQTAGDVVEHLRRKYGVTDEADQPERKR